MFRKLIACAAALAAALTLVPAAGLAPARAQPTISKPESLPAGIANARAISTLTISGGSVTASQQRHLIETEGGSASDDLTTVVPPAWIKTGDVITLSLADASHDATLKNGSGANLIATPSGVDWPLTELDQTADLRWTGSQWRVVAPRSILIDDLASTATGKGAALIGIEDSGGLITATTVEGALAELAANPGKVETAADKTALAALTLSGTAGKAAVIVADEAYGGSAPVFFRTTDDISALVAGDPAGALYVPFAGGDGSTGGFARQAMILVDPAAFGAVYGRDVSDSVATANAAALEAANLWLATRGGGAIGWGARTLEIDCSVSNQTPVALALRTAVALIGVKPENSSVRAQQLGMRETGSVLRLHEGSNCSLVGARTGAKSPAIINMVLDGNKRFNTNPGNHGVMMYAHDSSNGHAAGAILRGNRIENWTGYSAYLWEAKPGEISDNMFRDGVFIGTGSDTKIKDGNNIDGNSPLVVAVTAPGAVSGNAIAANYHDFYDGLKVTYDDNGGTAITGLTDGNNYFIVNALENSFQLSSTYGGSAISISGGSGAQYFRPFANHPALFMSGANHNTIEGNFFYGPQWNAIRSATFTRSANTVVVSDYQGFLYNNIPVMFDSSADDLPAPLSENVVYYLRQSSGSAWNIYAGPGSGASQVTLSDAGTGTLTVKAGKLDETLLFVGGAEGKQGLAVVNNRFAGSWGPNVTLIDMGLAVRWSATNDLYEKNWGGGTYKTIVELGSNVVDENIGRPYSRRLEFTNGTYATNDDAPITVNQGDLCAVVRKQASGALRCNFTAGVFNFTDIGSSITTDYSVFCDQRYDLNIGHGTKFVGGFDVWIKNKYADSINTSSTPVDCTMFYGGW